MPTFSLAVPTFVVSDVGATARWYEKELGFKFHPFPNKEPFAFASLVRDEVEIMLQRIEGYQKPDLRSLRPAGVWDAYIRMKGVKEFYERIREKVTIGMPLKKQRYGDWEFEVMDPNGYILVFSELLNQGVRMERSEYLKEALREFQKIKALAEKAMVQVEDQDLFVAIDAESNSIAILMKHLSGNMRSRWMNFLTTDGEKSDRNRDSEFFIEAGDTREDLLQRWEAGWRYVFEALEPLTAEDLERTVFIRNEPHSVLQAVNRQLTHYASHIGQIVLLAKHFAAGRWQTLSTPRGPSGEFKATMPKKSRQS